LETTVFPFVLSMVVERRPTFASHKAERNRDIVFAVILSCGKRETRDFVIIVPRGNKIHALIRLPVWDEARIVRSGFSSTSKNSKKASQPGILERKSLKKYIKYIFLKTRYYPKV
jgi:hypothetical protein